jgi:hypothetical protein
MSPLRGFVFTIYLFYNNFIPSGFSTSRIMRYNLHSSLFTLHSSKASSNPKILIQQKRNMSPLRGFVFTIYLFYNNFFPSGFSTSRIMRYYYHYSLFTIHSSKASSNPKILIQQKRIMSPLRGFAFTIYLFYNNFIPSGFSTSRITRYYLLYSLFTIRYSLFTIHSSLFTFHFSLFI